MKKVNLKKKLSLLLSGILCTNIIWSNTALAEPKKEKNTKRPTEITSLGDYKTYNAVAWGNHTASGADIEGRLAVKGDIKAPTEADVFDIGAAYKSGIGVGSHLEDNGTPAFLLGGDITNPVGKLQLCFGYGAMTFENTPIKLHSSMDMKGTFIESKANINKTFDQILTDVKDKVGIAGKVKGSSNLISDMSFGLAESINRPNTLINTTHRDVEVFNVGSSVAQTQYDQAKLPKVSGNKNIIIYSEATKVNFNRGVAFDGKEVASGSPIMKELAPRIVWVFPNATEVMVFKNDVAGTVIAPNATVSIHGGSINGQVFGKNIEQVKKVISGPNGEQIGNRGEIHNFLFNWDIFDELEEKSGDITLTKLNEDKKPLANVEFVIRNEKGEEVRKGKTDENGKVTFTALPEGKYTYEEVAAPEGYVTDETKYEFTIIDGQVIQKEVINKQIKGSLQLKKVSSELDQDGQKVFLQGAEFVIKDADKNIVKEGLITNIDGIIDVTGLKYGTYYYQEVTAPEGHELDSTEYKFEIKENGEVVKVEVSNTKIEEPTPEIIGSLEITKKGDDDKLLAGAEFNVLDKDGKVVKTGITDSNGIANITGLKAGDYKFVEVKSPEGYILENIEIEFSITEQGQVVSKEIINKREKGSLELQKVDADNNKNFLAGAIFKITDLDGNAKEYTTNADGKIILENLPTGTYKFEEIKAPAGYELNENNKGTFIIKNGEVTVTPITNKKIEPIIGSLEITKKGDDGKFLAGAEFNVLDKDGKVVKTGITDSNGIANITGLEAGDYKLVEVKSPEGYLLDGKEFSFTITEQGQVISKEVVNKRIKSNVNLKKVDSKDKTIALEGAEFIIKNANKEVILKDKVTNKDGVIELGQLEFGTYYYQEVVAPEGYVLDDKEYEFKITEHGKTIILEVSNTKVDKPIPPTPINGYLEIKKLDASNGAALAGAEFTVFNEASEEVGKGITDENGMLRISNLPHGKYKAVETKTPENYEVIGSNEFEFEITADGKAYTKTVYNKRIVNGIGNIELKKVDKLTNEPLSGAKFVIKIPKKDGMSENDRLVAMGVTDVNGIVRFENIPFGEYVYQEVEAPAGYVLDSTEYPITVKRNGFLWLSKTVDIIVTNEKSEVPPTPINGCLEIIKIDADSEEVLAGAEFKIYKGEEVVATGITGENGKFRISNLENGTYKAVETKAPEGYELEALREFEFTISNENKVETLKVTNKKIEESIPPTPINGYLEITKVDADDNKKLLEGAEFTLYNEVGEEVGKAITNKEGKIRISNLKDGKYTAIETKAPEGYEINANNRFEFELNDGNKIEKETVTNKKIKEPIPPTPINGYLEVIKIDADSEEVLAGAEFKIYKGEEVVATGITGENGKFRISNLENGTYKAVETKAPEGYELEALREFEFTISNENKVETLKVKNKKIEEPIPPTPINGYLEITKVDADDNKKLLEGAEFTLYNEVGEEVGKAITNKEGKIRISNLKDGKYTAIETKAPEGYELNANNKFEFELNDGNKVEKETVTNKAIKKPEPPVDPEKPEPPVDPEKPEPPVDPEKPEPPVDPEKPEPPVDPEKPEPPVDPEKPEPPVDPEKPEPPVDPEKPEPPVDPEKPEPPVDPEKPEPPVDPEKPEPPVDPEKPEPPVNPEKPEPPVNPERPTNPEIPKPVKPTNPGDKYPETSDAGIVGNVIMGLVAIAGLFIINRRRY